jgi:hypothetical protein
MTLLILENILSPSFIAGWSEGPGRSGEGNEPWPPPLLTIRSLLSLRHWPTTEKHKKARVSLNTTISVCLHGRDIKIPVSLWKAAFEFIAPATGHSSAQQLRTGTGIFLDRKWHIKIHCNGKAELVAERCWRLSRSCSSIYFFFQNCRPAILGRNLC